MPAPRLALSIALSDNPNTRPIIDGAVAPEAIGLSERRPSIGDVLAAVALCRVGHFRNVDVVAVDRDGAGTDAMGGAANIHHSQVFDTHILVRADAGSWSRPTSPGSVSG